MFTGIIEEVGRISGISGSGAGSGSGGRERRILTIAAEKVTEGMQIGDSVAIDGVCQTVTAFSGASFTVDTLAESLKKTTLSRLSTGSRVNLERAVTPLTRMGGHFVQGHVNGTAVISGIRKSRDNIYLTVKLDSAHLRYCIPEGSIALDGVSLTIAELNGPLITLNIIPHTFEYTTLCRKKEGDLINVETDMLGRYVERLLGMAASADSAPGPGGITMEKLKEFGF
jgi:riboflavin synthase